jgi:AcrR family transcriptional regulator
MDPKEVREHAIKDAKCALILDAAHKIFSEKGYLNARLEDIAAAAGFSKPSLYSYYQDKEAIFLSLAIREMQNVSRKIEAAVSSGGAFVSTLESILRIIFANFAQTFSYFSTASNFRAMGGLEIDASKRKDLMELFHETMGKSLHSIEELIRRSRKTGEISSNQDAAELSWYIISLIQGVHMRSWMTRKACDIDVSVKQVIDFIMNGISSKKTQTGRVLV